MVSDASRETLLAAELLRSIGVPPTLVGHGYLLDAILLSYHGTASGHLYVAVASRYPRTSAGLVERSIRYAIRATWKRMTLEAKREFIRCRTDKRKRMPTGEEFVVFVVENMENVPLSG